MIRRHLTILALSLLPVAAVSLPGAVHAQLPRIGIIDVYGLHKIAPSQIREALGVAVGDSLTSMTMFEVPARLAAIPGVSSASIDPVCCEDGKTMLYVGVAEDGAPVLELRAPPDGASRLPIDVMVAAEQFANAAQRAAMRGFMKEDVS